MWNYTDKVIDHFMNPRNVGEVENPDGVGQVGNAACGDALKLTFKLDEAGKIADVKFKTFGCAAAIATSSTATDMVIGMTVEEALKVTNKIVVEKLGGLPSQKLHCSVLAEEAIKKAIEDYMSKKKA
jgi:FeS cluster assembly scaffold protein NifU